MLALFSAVVAFAQVQLEVKDEQLNNQSLLGLRIRIVNNSGRSYDNVTLQYNLKKRTSETYALDRYYTGNWTFSISQSNENVVVSVNIPHLSEGVSPDESGFSVGIHRTDWQTMTKSTEHGFPLGSSFDQALDYAVICESSLIGGSSYIDPNSVIPSLRFVGLQPVQDDENKIPAWLEIENYGTMSVNLSEMTIVYPLGATIVSSVVSSEVLLPGKKIRVCADQQNCANDDVVAVEPMLPFGSSGEVLVRYNDVAIDYLSWGKNAGALASEARMANVQYSKIRYDVFFYDEYWHALWEGVFFKKVDGVWYSYSTKVDNINTTERPEPIPYNNEESLCLEGDENRRMVRFAWHPVEGAIGYNLTVKREDGYVLFDQFMNGVHSDIELGEGVYEWSVRVVLVGNQYSMSNPWLDHYAIWKKKNVVRCSDITDEHYLQVPQYGVHKDTRMLVPNWGELTEYPEISWDHPDVFVYNLDYHYGLFRSLLNDLFLEVGWRCWAVAAQILNSYYGGNLTQDEIKYYGKTVGFERVTTVYGTHSRPERDKVIGPFVLGEKGSGYPSEVKMTLKWALNLTDESQLEHGSTGGAFDEDFVKDHIGAGRPIYYLQNSHIMIVDGYRFSAGNFQIHRVNIKNGGEAEWTDNVSGNIRVNYYFVPKNVTNPRMSDPRVHIDSDGDGIIDFDEIERFHTNPNAKDSDGDGIEDFVEIFSYTKKEPLLRKMQISSENGNSYIGQFYLGDYIYEVYDSEFKTKENPFGEIVRFESFADIDGDGKRAERDVDSDHPNNDGLWDGAEDLNHNGYVDNDETDPYNISDDYATSFNPVETVEWDAPSLVGVYALDGINIDDNVTCYSGMHGYCQIASESALQYYAVSLGSNSTVGDIYSKGGILLRKNASVVGDVSIYSLPISSMEPELLQSSSVTGLSTLRSLGEWPYVVSDNIHHSLEGKDSWIDLTIPSGQTVTLNGDVSFRNLIVQPGATLKLGVGTINVGNITFETGSKLEFVNPGRETVIIADGNVIWRAQITNSDLQTVAKGFKLIEYAPGYIHIDGDWAGTIHARWCELTLGQAKKAAYGSFVAKKVYLGNGLTIYRVHFSPIPLTDMV